MYRRNTHKNGEVIITNRKAAEIFETSVNKLYQLKNIKALWKTVGKVKTENGDPLPYENSAFLGALKTMELVLILHKERKE